MDSITLVYVLPMTMIVSLYMWLNYRKTVRNRAEQVAARTDGLHEPASLHPLIDPVKCLGCASCITACPEHSVLGLVSKKVELIAAANCIGHGACRTACPTDAITLVFGTESRGVEIPHIDADFQTNVPGIYIAGELGGMGLVRNAIEQGKQAVHAIAQSLKGSSGPKLELLIVGAGPAGIAASLAAKEAGLRYTTIDQDSLGGTVAHFPRRKLVMTQPVELPLAGMVKFRETSKEALLEFWQQIVTSHDIAIESGRRMERIEPLPNGFRVSTTDGAYEARRVLLCLGRRGTPRLLGVPGEERSKVVYRLLDAQQYRNQKVLVVGGGDSAIEAAVSIAEEPGATVTLAYRGEAFSRVKPKNRSRIEAAVREGLLEVCMQTEIAHIEDSQLLLKHKDELTALDNDAVIVCAGGIMPKKLLDDIGVQFEVKYGTS
jgi:thioredoxin reductase (NADPH)